MNYYLSSYLLSKINLLFFSLNPNFLGVAMTRTKNSYIFVTYVPCWGFFFTVKVRVYLVKSGITYKVSTVRCTFNKKSDMFYRLQFKVI